MKNLLFGVILGLLAVVHSTPVNAVTQDDFYREAVTDGFLIANPSLNLLTTESPKRNATVQATRQPSSESKESDIPEGNGDSNTQSSTSTMLPTYTEDYSSGSSTMPNEVNPKESDIWEGSGLGDTNDKTTTTVSPRHMEESSSDSSTIQSPQPGFMSSSVPNEVQPKESDKWESRGLGETNEKTTATVLPKHTDYSSSDSSTNKQIQESKLKQSWRHNPDLDKLNVNPTSAMNKGHTTPGWIIIVGFIVGVAALVIVCVAIATRDKWNAPSQASQLETKTNSANQQRELEMETFLHKDKPRENGKAAEYTVIPLDELSEKYPSH
ncbi:uncharacterized protein LOC118342913 [Morone saxatilis]|uniref:uncharacterized protein LOC118342913 n=1 Tax=Morone saxatilis TaxID=34816 RepID=UPI0015E206D7|nr:uncharacterized protein LOC118342913 [Morone saxatilis]